MVVEMEDKNIMTKYDRRDPVRILQSRRLIRAEQVVRMRDGELIIKGLDGVNM